MTELQQDRLAELIRPIRESLDPYDLGPDPDLEVRPTGELTTAADELCRLVRATQLNKAANRLPRLIAEITTACYRTSSTETWQALASTYRTAHDVTVKLGFYDLSTVALDRMAWAAERASDTQLAAIRQYMRALVYFREGEHTTGLRLVDTGQHILGQADESRETLAVAGQLHLGAVVIAARARDADAVRTHLAEARSYAERTGEASSVHWLSFGPTNVDVHAVSAEGEMRRYGAALKLAEKVHMPHSWAPSRRSHFYIDRAHSEMETGRTDAALGSLLTARKLAPQQTRYHTGARETIKGLVYMSRRTPDTLNHMAAWIGLRANVTDCHRYVTLPAPSRRQAERHQPIDARPETAVHHTRSTDAERARRRDVVDAEAGAPSKPETLAFIYDRHATPRADTLEERLQDLPRLRRQARLDALHEDGHRERNVLVHAMRASTAVSSAPCA